MLSSPVDMAIIGAAVLLLFGPKRMPELGKALGQGIGNFKRALSDAQDEFTHAVNHDKKSDPVKVDAEAPAATTAVTPVDAAVQPIAISTPSVTANSSTTPIVAEAPVPTAIGQKE